MKQKKFLAIILIASSAFLGTGYSWWTDSLEVQGVVSTGNFRVARVRAELAQYINCKGGKQLKNIMNETCLEDSDNFSYNMKDLFPGKTYLLNTEFKNKGSIPAVIDCVIVEPKDNEMESNIHITGTVKIIGGAQSPEPIPIDLKLVDLQDKLAKIKNWKLEPGQSLVFENFTIALTKEVCKARTEIDDQGKRGKIENIGEGKNGNFNLKISFKQHNRQ